MLTFERLHPNHLRYIEVQSVQTGDVAHALTPEAAEVLAAQHGTSAWAGGRCLCAAGFILQWPGRAQAWALVSRHAGPHMVGIVRRMRRELDAYQQRCERVEMHVRFNFDEGHRLALALGFEVETPEARRFWPDGAAATLYVRIRG